MYRTAIDNTDPVFEQYEAYKRSYKQTDQCCSEQGIRFSPMILEAHGGGFSQCLRAVIDWIARHSAEVHGESAPATSLQIAQRISCSLHRENARALLKRMAPQDNQPASSWMAADFSESW